MSTPRRGLGQGAITKGALYILIASVGFSFLYLLSGEEMRLEIARIAVASGQSVWFDFKIWQLITSPFLEIEFVALIFQGFMLWMFIPALERWWGTKRFLKFAAYTSVTGVVVGTVAAVTIPSVPNTQPISGLDPFIYSCIVAYGILFAQEKVQFFGVVPLTGKQMTIGICCFLAAFVIIGQQWAEGTGYAGAMLVAWILTNGKWTPKLWYLKRKQKRIRSKLRIVRDDDDPKKWLN